MFASNFFRKAAIAGLAAALFCAPAQSFAKETVKVGFIGPLTGGLSSLGVGGRNSAELAVQEANEDPNTKFLYEMTAYDDECKPNVGIQVATKAASDRKMVGAVTHYCSAVALGTVGIYHRFKMPAIVWGAVQPDITYGNDYKEIFRTPGTMINQNEQAAKFMYGKGYRNIAIIHDITDYGKSHAEYFTKFFEKLDGKIVGSFGVNSDQQDFTAELTKVKALNPDVLYLGGLVPVGVRVRSQMAKLGMTCQFEGCSGISIARWKIWAFTAGNFICGIAGAYYAMMLAYISPANFAFSDSLLFLSILLLGGLGSRWGVILAAAFMVMLPEKFQVIQEYRYLIYSAIVLLMILYRPAGLLPRRPRTYTGRA